jgi:hypothetical protein
MLTLTGRGHPEPARGENAVILAVEDDEQIARMLGLTHEQERYRVIGADQAYRNREGYIRVYIHSLRQKFERIPRDSISPQRDRIRLPPASRSPDSDSERAQRWVARAALGGETGAPRKEVKCTPSQGGQPFITRRLPHSFGQTLRMGVHAPPIPAGRPGGRKALVRACVLGHIPAGERLDLLLDSDRLGAGDGDAATERAPRRHDNAVCRDGTRAARRHVRAQLLPEVTIELAGFEDLGRRGLRSVKLRTVERRVPARVLERLHMSGALLRGGQLLDGLRAGRRGAVCRAADERAQHPDR